MKQLTLFPSPKPLMARFGEDFFRSAPRTAGVYIMTGDLGRVLYIGQSKNLRARLGTYKNARPDCAPRKIVRLVHEVRSIVWEKCSSAETAKAREGELLRVHRPKFNVAGTWPAPPRYFRVGLNTSALELDCFPDRGDLVALEDGAADIRQFGPFKASFVGLYAALLRLLWAASHDVAAGADYPAGFFSSKPPRPARFSFAADSNSANGAAERHEIFSALCDFLDAGINHLIPCLKARIPSSDDIAQEGQRKDDPLPAFHKAILALDFETIELFSRILRPT